jgi:hypothetical protein
MKISLFFFLGVRFIGRILRLRRTPAYFAGLRTKFMNRGILALIVMNF